MRVYTNVNPFQRYRGYGDAPAAAPSLVDPANPIAVTNQDVQTRLAVLENAVRTLAAAHQSDTQTLAAAVQQAQTYIQQLAQQGEALQQMMTATLNGIRVGWSPTPSTFNMPGQQTNIGVPTHALRNQNIYLTDGGDDSSTAVQQATPAAGQPPVVQPLSNADFYGSPDAFYSGGEDD